MSIISVLVGMVIGATLATCFMAMFFVSRRAEDNAAGIYDSMHGCPDTENLSEIRS